MLLDTSATAHPLDELAYIVEPRAPGPAGRERAADLLIYYANDDDGDRRLGSIRAFLPSPAGGGTVRVRT